MKIIFGVFTLLLLQTLTTIAVDSGEFDERLTPEQRQILRSYESVSNLDYGDKCNFPLETKSSILRENVKELLKKAFASGISQGLAGKNEEDFHLSQSTEDLQDELISQIEVYVKKVNESRDGPNAICNDTRGLYCDEFARECRCGVPKAKKGFNFVAVDGKCKFDLGSGCGASDFADLTTLTCKEGSACVTGIGHAECTLSNVLEEAFLNPTRYRRLMASFGYICFCNKDE